jgi:AraC-like DNA-binding protein
MDAMTELRTLIARHAGPERLTPTALPGVNVIAATAPTEPVGAVAYPALAVTAQGAKRTVLGDAVYGYEAGEYLVVSVDLPVTAHITRATPEAPFLAVGFELRPAAIAALLLDTAALPDVAPGPPAGIAVSRAPAALLDVVVRMLRLLDEPADAAVLGPATERELLWRLVTGEQGATVRQIGLADSRLAQVARAISRLRRHYDEPVRVEELAALTGMSPSSFHRHFRAVTTMTPIQYQKQLRLQEARARLIARKGDVAGVGFAVGYVSASQFNREYRRLFGVTPGRDAERLRRLEPDALT